MQNTDSSYNMLNKRIHTNHVISCSIEFLGSVVYDINDTGLIHKYTCWSYSYVEGNAGTFHFNEKNVEVNPENGIFIPPNTEHYLKCNGPNKMQLVYTGIEGINFPDVVDVESFYLSLKDSSCIKIFNATLSKVISSLNTANSPNVLNSFAPLILEKVLNVHNFVNAGGHINTTNTSSGKNIVTSASSILCEDFSKNISLKELSARLFMSERTLSKIFLETLNMRFKEYYLMLKMEYALHILSTSDTSISQVAEILGFCDVQYFSKKFKHYFNEAPYSVQKNSKKQKNS